MIPPSLTRLFSFLKISSLVSLSSSYSYCTKVIPRSQSVILSGQSQPGHGANACILLKKTSPDFPGSAKSNTEIVTAPLGGFQEPGALSRRGKRFDLLRSLLLSSSDRQ